MTTKCSQHRYDQIRRNAHPYCALCGSENRRGLGLSFTLQPDGDVMATFEAHKLFQGYEGILHGGVTSALLDSAMTHSLFAHGIVAVTGEMTVRFREPVALDEPLVVRGRMIRSQPPLHYTQAEITQGGRLRAKATGKFMEISPIEQKAPSEALSSQPHSNGGVHQ